MVGLIMMARARTMRMTRMVGDDDVERECQDQREGDDGGDNHMPTLMVMMTSRGMTNGRHLMV